MSCYWIGDLILVNGKIRIEKQFKVHKKIRGKIQMHLFYLKIPLSHLQTSVFCISLVEGLGFPYRERDEKVNIEMVDLLFA